MTRFIGKTLVLCIAFTYCVYIVDKMHQGIQIKHKMHIGSDWQQPFEIKVN